MHKRVDREKEYLFKNSKTVFMNYVRNGYAKETRWIRCCFHYCRLVIHVNYESHNVYKCPHKEEVLPDSIRLTVKLRFNDFSTRTKID